LKDANVADLTANIGAEVHGVQLSKLTDAGKDELALFVAQKKVVAFREQDFADLPIQDALNIGGYFGRHHIHPTSGAPEGYPLLRATFSRSEQTQSHGTRTSLTRSSRPAQPSYTSSMDLLQVATRSLPTKQRHTTDFPQSSGSVSMV
jgi:alpha-ketoglutarate-dependent taurine dioxygenase